MIRISVVLAAVLVAVLAAGATASAANSSKPTITVDCGADGSFQVLGNPGNGNFTPAKVIGGGNLIPVAFSNQHATFTDPDGNVFTQDEPDVSHPAPANKDLMSCHFSATASDPSGGTATFSGDVIAFEVPPQR